VAEALAARRDGDLVHRVGVLGEVGDQRVARLVVRRVLVCVGVFGQRLLGRSWKTHQTVHRSFILCMLIPFLPIRIKSSAMSR